MKHYVGVDVGTASARAGIFDENGALCGVGTHPVEIFRPRADFVQQSSTQIWDAVSAATRTALSSFRGDIQSIQAIGFDATCSLVVSDRGGGPVSVSPDNDREQDVIVWMDHRATGDADEINAIGGAPLQFVGGVISPEMQLPKLRWLKREARQAWEAAGSFRDLPDWLVHRATGSPLRSICSAGCKWTYDASRGIAGEGWNAEFLASIGLADLSENNYASLGNRFLLPGECAGHLSERAAAELGLPLGTPVAAGMIDAYAGALGTLFARDADGRHAFGGRLALIAGTSACHIVATNGAHFVPGVWGPYNSALLPGVWALEGGQSAAGALLDNIIARHSANTELKGGSAQAADRLMQVLASMGPDISLLTASRHVLPDFLGNRSPLAEPWRKGAISGLAMRHDLEDLALDYLAAIQALAYGTRHIISEMRAAGVDIDSIVVSGGLSKNSLYLHEHADATGCRVIVPDAQEPVLLGAAVSGAAAADRSINLQEWAGRLSGSAKVIEPRRSAAAYHDAKFAVYRAMQNDFASYRNTMREFVPTGA